MGLSTQLLPAKDLTRSCRHGIRSRNQFRWHLISPATYSLTSLLHAGIGVKEGDYLGYMFACCHLLAILV